MSTIKPAKTPAELGLLSYEEVLDKTYNYIVQRRDGDIKSLKTPWTKFNSQLMGGLEWNTLTVIGGRSASGKSLMANMITSGAFDHNPDQDFAVLDFQFEMLARSTGIRNISAKTGIPHRNFASITEPISDDDLDAARKYIEEHKHRQIYVAERPQTVDKMYDTIENFCRHMNKHVLVTVDHSLLIKKDSSESSQLAMLFNLGNMLAEARRKLPISVILLSQLNRDIDSQARMEEGSIGNYVKDSDIYGSDALLQFSDVLIGINRPMKNDIRYYGPRGYLMTENTIAAHFLKVRNGKTGLLFFEADFERATMKEMEKIPHTMKEAKEAAKMKK